MTPDHEETRDIIAKLSILQDKKVLVYIYNDNGFIKYTKEVDNDTRQSFTNKSTSGKSNNQPINDSTKLPITVKYVVYAYKAVDGI